MTRDSDTQQAVNFYSQHYFSLISHLFSQHKINSSTKIIDIRNVDLRKFTLYGKKTSTLLFYSAPCANNSAIPSPTRSRLLALAGKKVHN